MTIGGILCNKCTQIYQIVSTSPMKDLRDNCPMPFLVFINMLEWISFIFVDAERLRALNCSMFTYRSCVDSEIILYRGFSRKTKEASPIL